MKPLIFISLFLLLPALAGGQEVFNCNGLWTNKPCEGQVLGSFAEKPHTPLTREQQEESRKRRLIHELELKQFNARQIVDKSEVVREAVDQCLEPLTTWEDCRRRLLEADGWLDRQIEAARRLAEDEKKDQEANETLGGAVTIINIQPVESEWSRQYYRGRQRPSFAGGKGERLRKSDRSQPAAEGDDDNGGRVKRSVKGVMIGSPAKNRLDS